MPTKQTPPFKPSKNSKFREELLAHYNLVREVRPATIKDYRWSMMAYERWLGRDLRPEDFERDQLNTYLVETNKDLAPATLKSRRTDFMVLWRFAHDERMVSRAPRKLRTVTLRSAPVDVWTAEEIREIIRFVERDRRVFRFFPRVRKATWWSAWIRVAWDTGLRLGDQLKLRRLTDENGEPQMKIVQEKTGNPVIVRLNRTTCNQLEDLWQEFADERLESNLMFGDLIARGNLPHEFKQIMAEGEFDGTLHKLRKSSRRTSKQSNQGRAGGSWGIVRRR